MISIKEQQRRTKISEAKKGKKRPPFSQVWKDKIGQSSKGRKLSEEQLKKKGIRQTGEKNNNWKGGFPKCKICGKKLTSRNYKLCNKHQGELRKGENNPMWKGGITGWRVKFLRSPEYNSWRIKVFERDKFLCQMPDCDKTERILNAHHIKKFEKYPELRLVTDNGITLCRRCHDKTKTREEKFEDMFLEIIKIK